MTEKLQAKNRKLVIRLIIITVAMFGFGFAMVPLYDVFCDVTGLNGKTGGRVAESDLVLDDSRSITVQLLVATEANLPWTVTAETNQIVVHPGEKVKVNFIARNHSSRAIVAQAIPSVTPGQAAAFLKKIECFCFDQMELKAGEKADMPLVFYIEEDLPEEIVDITLSYKVFNITDRVAIVDQSADEEDSQPMEAALHEHSDGHDHEH